MDSNESKIFDSLNFSIHIPQPYESNERTDDRFVYYGTGNVYPQYLVKLYEDCPIHAMIINQKTSYIISQGIRLKGGGEIDFKLNQEESHDEFVEKIIKQFLTFNAFAIEVCYNAFEEPIEYNVVPIHYLRMNKSKTKFWYCDDWKNPTKPVVFERWKKTATDTSSKIFYFDGSDISLNRVYPKPEYNGCITSIETDIAIRNFNLNNIKEHFATSTVITTYGNTNTNNKLSSGLSPKDLLKREIEKSRTGEEGKKILITTAIDKNHKMDIENISANDWDKAYTLIADKVEKDILLGHQVTSQLLYGVQTAGKLGNSNEVEISYQIHKKNYIANKRNQILSAFEKLFDRQFEFKEDPIVEQPITEQTMLQILTIDEIRKKLGVPPLPDGMGNVLVAQANKPQPTQVQVLPNEVEQPIIEEEKKNYRKLTDEDYEKIAHVGFIKDEFELIDYNSEKFDKESEVASYLISKDIQSLTIKQLVDLIKNDLNIDVSASDITGYINKLRDSGIINVVEEDGKIRIKPQPEPNLPKTSEIMVMYDYQKRPDVKGPDLIENSRDFCVKLINSNKFYSREDIQTMSALFGYDVFEHCGGWYFNPETQKTETRCRHHWVKVQVKRKS